MKPLLAWIVIAWVLTACSASGSFVPSEPLVDNSAASQKAKADYAMQQAQKQQADAYSAAVNETAQARAAGNALTQSQKATAQAMDVARAQLAMTADAANLPSTQVAANATADARSMLQAQQQDKITATAQAMDALQTAQSFAAEATVSARSMLAAAQQSETTATAQAMQRENVSEKQAASTSKWQSDLMAWVIPLLVVIAFGMAVLLAVLFFSGLSDDARAQRGQENQRLALLGNLFGLPTQTHPYTEVLPPRSSNTPGIGAGPAVLLNGDAPLNTVVLSYDDQVLEDRAEAREEAARCKLAMKLVRDAINQVGASANRIPPPAQLNWPDGAWTIAVALLRPYGVENLPGEGGGIFLVGQYSTLQSLYNAIGVKTLGLFSHSD